MRCLDENAVLDFVRGQIPAAEAREIGAHLDTCPACRALVTAAAKSSIVAWSSSNKKAPSISQVDTSLPVPTPSGKIPDDAPTVPSLSNMETNPFLRSPEMLAPGQLLDGRFRLRRAIGRGSMGQIFAAYDERLRVQVALKMLLPELASSRRYLERLQNEIVVARRVSHANVCRVYDLGHSAGIHFISMELVEGETLEVRLQRESLPERAALHILRQIVSGLDAAHREGVIHRDLKPSNIMINARGHVTVMDFGLARDLVNESTDREGGGGSIVGTPAYWSPEQARGEPATPASDLFSLGVIACRVLTGSRPQIRPGEDPVVRVREPFRTIVTRCLELDPSKRYASADALQLALAAAERDARTHRVAYLVGAAVFVAAGVLFAWGRGLRGVPPPAVVAGGAPPAYAAPTEVAATNVPSPSVIPELAVDALPESASSAPSARPPMVHVARPADASTSGKPSSGKAAAAPTARPAKVTTPRPPARNRDEVPDAGVSTRIPVFD